jgi:hypothetical protein
MSTTTFGVNEDGGLTLSLDGEEEGQAPTAVSDALPTSIAQAHAASIKWNADQMKDTHTLRVNLKFAARQFAKKLRIFRDQTWHLIHNPWFFDIDKGPEQMRLLDALWINVLQAELDFEDRFVAYMPKHGAQGEFHSDKYQQRMQILIDYMTTLNAINGGAAADIDEPHAVGKVYEDDYAAEEDGKYDQSYDDPAVRRLQK